MPDTQNPNPGRVTKPWTEHKSLIQKQYRRKETIIAGLKDYHHDYQADIYLVINDLDGKTYVVLFTHGDIIKSLPSEDEIVSLEERFINMPR